MAGISTIRDLAFELARALRDGVEPPRLTFALIGNANELEDGWTGEWETQFDDRPPLTADDFVGLGEKERQAWAVSDGTLPGDASRLLQLTSFADPVFLLRKAETGGGPRRICVGRGKRNDVVIGHPTLSTLHAQVDIVGETASLIDSKSRNGTWVNDVRLVAGEPAPLRSADSIRLGSASFLFMAPAGLRMFLKMHLLEELDRIKRG
jgi:hypothetical protein